MPRTIGYRIRARRQELGLTQTDLARKLGVAYQVVQDYEHSRRRPTAAMLERIASALKTKPQAITPQA